MINEAALYVYFRSKEEVLYQMAASATLATLSLCLDVARWYRPGYRLTPHQLGDSNAAAALRVVGGAIPGGEEGTGP